jgi:hypothetical protein
MKKKKQNYILIACLQFLGLVEQTRNAYKLLVGKHEWKKPLRKHGRNGMIVLRGILRN